MRNWSSRYIMLTGPTLSYKLKADSKDVRGAFDLSPGCIVTEVNEESMGIKGKKIFSFWIVWPQDKHGNPDDDKSAEKGHPPPNQPATINAASEESDDEEETLRPKDLKQIVASEVLTHKKQQQQVEEQIERHQAYDRNLSVGMKVAALSVGGVVIGALTAGVGLVPYITVVGLAAVAGGGAVALQFRKPSDSRLILAAESMQEAMEWKTAIERQISQLEENRKPMLPPSANAQAISSIIGMSAPGGGGMWKCVEVCEGMRLLEQTDPADLTRCMKAQIVVRSTPVAAFLSLMEGIHFWPKGGSFKVVKSWDDHADIIGVTAKSECAVGRFGARKTVTRRLCLSRFWKLDDDGIYLVTLNSTKYEDFPTSVDATSNSDSLVATNRKRKKGKEDTIPTSPSSSAGKGANLDTTDTGPTVNAVITVAPRKDHVEYDDDLAEALVTVTVQTSTTGDWQPGELDAFLKDFLTHHLLEMKQYLLYARFGLEERGMNEGIAGMGMGLGLGSTSGELSTGPLPTVGWSGEEALFEPTSPTSRQRSAVHMLAAPSDDSLEVGVRTALQRSRSLPIVISPADQLLQQQQHQQQQQQQQQQLLQQLRPSPVKHTQEGGADERHTLAKEIDPYQSQSQSQSQSQQSFPEVAPLHRDSTRGHPNGRMHGLIRRLGGSRTRDVGEEGVVGAPTWRTSPSSPTHAESQGQGDSRDQNQTTSQAVAAKRKLSLRKSLISLSPFGYKPDGKEGKEGVAVGAAGGAVGGITLSRTRSNSPLQLHSPSNAGISINAGAGAGEIGKGVAAGAVAGSGSGSGSGTPGSTLKRKGRLFKEESSALRGQIAAKEYEVQRISKDLERKLEKAQVLSLATVGVSAVGSAPSSAAASVTTPPTMVVSVSAPLSAEAAAAAASRPSLEDDKGLKFLKTEISDASHNLQGQAAELAQLKSKYVALTGLSYEQSGRRKGALSRLRAFGSSSSGHGGGAGGSGRYGSDSQASAASTGSGSGSGSGSGGGNGSSRHGGLPGAGSSGGGGNGSHNATQSLSTGLGTGAAGAAVRRNLYSNGGGSGGGSGTGTGHTRGSRLPSHWQPTRMERIDSYNVSKNTDADVMVNIMVVAMFLLSLVATIGLANVISLI